MTKAERELTDAVALLRRRVTRDKQGRYWPSSGIDRALDRLFETAKQTKGADQWANA
jgi:hypothetical protein